MLLLGVEPSGKISEGLGGITRLQKLLFLLEQEEGLVPSREGFEFAAYKAGPYSSKLYDDLEFLENLGLIEGEVAAEATEEEAAEVDLLEFDELMGESADDSGGTPADGLAAADAYEERRFKITKDGTERIENLIASGKYAPVIDGIRRIKGKYGNHSLSDLLFYVYKKYPEMTVESEIKEQVLRRPR
jgi:hypothetical protein